MEAGLSCSRDPQVFQHTLPVSLASLPLVALLESYPSGHNKAYYVCGNDLYVRCFDNCPCSQLLTGSILLCTAMFFGQEARNTAFP